MLGVSGTEAARLVVTVGADTTGLNRGLGQAERRVQGFGSQLGGLAVAAGGVYAVREAFDATIGAAIDWESQFAGVEKTVDGTTAELADLEAELRGMAKTMPVARGELAAIAEQAGALGIATEDIGEFTEVVAQIGATTNVSSEQAATALGQLSNVLGLTQADFDNFGAALVDLGNKGASTEAQILEIASRAGAGADLIGIAADATLGWSSAVANLGIEAEAGGSSLQRFFLGAAEHVGAAGEELELMADTARVSVGEFTDLFNNDASAALQQFIGGLGELTQAEQLAVLEALGFNDVRIQRALLGLAGNVDNLTDSLEIGSEAWADNTALTEEYGKRAQTTASRIEMLGNRFSDLGVKLGESQSGPVDWVLTSLEGWATGLEKSFDDLGNIADAWALNWGDLHDTIEQEATAIGADVADFQDRVTKLMDRGLGFEEAVERARADLLGLPPVVDEATRGAIAAWKQADLGGTVVEDVEKIDDLFSRGGAFDAIPEEVREAMAKAREEAVAGTAGVMDALLNLGNEDEYEQAWQDYLDGANDVFTDDARAKFIAGQFAGDAFNDGLHSDDSARVEETVGFVNDQLRAFDLLNPGVLSIGRDVPANLQAGMEEIFPELEQYLLERHGETLDSLTLDDAEQLGIDGIYLWWQGMQSEEENAGLVAAAIATRALNELDVSGLAWVGGSSVGGAWANGLTSALWAANPEVATAVNAMKRMLGGSLPEDGPLAGDTAEQGGRSVGGAWVSGLVTELGVGQDAIGAALATALTPDLSMLSGPYAPEIAYGYGMGAPGSSGGGDTYITEVNLYFEGEAPSDAPQIADLVQRAERMATVGVGG